MFDVARAAAAGALPAALGSTLGAAKMREDRAFAFAKRLRGLERARSSVLRMRGD
jgi:hypothetical protein